MQDLEFVSRSASLGGILDILESDVGMDEDRRTEDCVWDRIEGSSCKGRHGQRNQTSRDYPDLKC